MFLWKELSLIKSLTLDLLGDLCESGKIPNFLYSDNSHYIGEPHE